MQSPLAGRGAGIRPGRGPFRLARMPVLQLAPRILDLPTRFAYTNPSRQSGLDYSCPTACGQILLFQKRGFYP